MKQPRFTVRDWIYIAVFGALWGALELTLGGYLHTLFPPLTNTLLTGVIMGGLGAATALVGRHFVPKRGAVLGIGCITALLKLLSLGGVVVGPLVAILAEAVLMEIALLPGKAPTRAHYVLAGALAVSWNFFHPFVMLPVLYGMGSQQALLKSIKDGSQILGLDEGQAAFILGLLLLLRVAVGGLSGWLAWDLGRAVGRRLARE